MRKTATHSPTISEKKFLKKSINLFAASHDVNHFCVLPRSGKQAEMTQIKIKKNEYV